MLSYSNINATWSEHSSFSSLNTGVISEPASFFVCVCAEKIITKKKGWKISGAWNIKQVTGQDIQLRNGVFWPKSPRSVSAVKSFPIQVIKKHSYAYKHMVVYHQKKKKKDWSQFHVYHFAVNSSFSDIRIQHRS